MAFPITIVVALGVLTLAALSALFVTDLQRLRSTAVQGASRGRRDR